MPSRLATLDHTGFMSEDLVRSERFYGHLFAARVMDRLALTTRDVLQGQFPLLFIDMGGHRFELFMADKYLPEKNAALRGVPRIAFEVTAAELDRAERMLSEKGVKYERGAPDYFEKSFVEEAIYFNDPDANEVELCRTWHAGKPRLDVRPDAINVGRISHVCAESIDIARDVAFYTEGLGMQLSEYGGDYAFLQTESLQGLILKRVDALSPRSVFGTGKIGWPAPEPPPGFYRYKGAHCAYSVDSVDVFNELRAHIEPWGGFDSGDLRASERPASTPSTYFYDPSGNRLQLIIIDEHNYAAGL